MMTTEGIRHLLELMSGDQARGYYIGWAEDDIESLSVASTLADLTELSGGGYARKAIGGAGLWTSAASSTGNGRKVTTPAAAFTASGFTWSLARTIFLATTASGTAGKLVAVEPLNGGAGIALSDGASFDVTMTIQCTPVDETA